MANPGVPSRPEDVDVRRATGEEYPSLLSILEAAMLDVDADRVRELVSAEADGAVLVAVEDGRVLGALVLDGREVTAIAVRPGRRGQGIGSALVERADREVDGALRAEFERSVRPFYETLGFEIAPLDDDRFRGLLR